MQKLVLVFFLGFVLFGCSDDPELKTPGERIAEQLIAELNLKSGTPTGIYSIAVYYNSSFFMYTTHNMTVTSKGLLLIRPKSPGNGSLNTYNLNELKYYENTSTSINFYF